MYENKESILFLFFGYFIFHLLLSDLFMMYNFFVLNDCNTSKFCHDNVITVIFIKLCDVVLKCVMGYYYIFNSCWLSSIDCLKHVMLAYINLLEKLVLKMLEYPTCVYTTILTMFVISNIFIVILKMI